MKDKNGKLIEVGSKAKKEGYYFPCRRGWRWRKKVIKRYLSGKPMTIEQKLVNPEVIGIVKAFKSKRRVVVNCKHVGRTMTLRAWEFTVLRRPNIFKRLINRLLQKGG